MWTENRIKSKRIHSASLFWVLSLAIFSPKCLENSVIEQRFYLNGKSRLTCLKATGLNGLI